MKTEEQIRQHIEYLNNQLNEPFYNGLAKDAFRHEIDVLNEVLHSDDYCDEA